MRRTALLCLMLFSLATATQATEEQENSENNYEETSKFTRWVAKNWGAKDEDYCYDTFYNWAAQLQDNVSQEFLTLATPEGFNINIRSKISNKIGPYFGYRWLFLGHTFDFLAKGEGKRRSEFTLRINSQLFNIDIIKRNTGGDFRLTDFQFQNHDMMQYVDDRKIGNEVTYDLYGANINMFLNHKKFSNPAAYSNGAIQVRSTGSPIVGLGFSRQKVNTQFMHSMVYDMSRKMHAEGGNEVAEFEDDFYAAHIPDQMVVYDVHAQFGLALNIVLSRQLLLSSSVIISPAIKYTNFKSEGSLAYDNTGIMDERINGPSSDSFFTTNTNLFGRASLTYNKDHWRGGLSFKYNRYVMSREEDNAMPTTLNSSYYDLSLYVGYCFGKKKAFRQGGDKRYQYEHSTLFK